MTIGTPREVFAEVELLERAGVRPPQVTELAYQLEQHGQPLADYPVTLDQALDLIQRWEPHHGN